MALAREYAPQGAEGQKRARNDREREELLKDKPAFTVTFTLRDRAGDVWAKGRDVAMHGKEGRGYDAHDFDQLELYCVLWLGLESGDGYHRVRLNDQLPADLREQSEPAELFIIPDGINLFAQNPRAANEIFATFMTTKFDSHVVNHKRHCNRLAQQVCTLADGKQQEPVDGIGCVHDLKTFANGHITTIKHTMAEVMAFDDLRNESAEVNLYTNTKRDPQRSGVAPHGDTEGGRVCGGRTGRAMYLNYYWVKDFVPVGTRWRMKLPHGSLYWMSKKAVGQDSAKSSLLCLKHSAGEGPRWAPTVAEWRAARKDKVAKKRAKKDVE